MGQSLRTSVKATIAKVFPDSTRLDVLYNLPKIESWRRAKVPRECPTFEMRTAMYDHLQREAIGDRPIDYVEFGVFQGESIKYWTELNSHEDSRFYGFDTFEGLPEDWKKFSGNMAENTFDCGGALPDLQDGRVEFFKGLFQDTLDGFLAEFRPHGQLVLHNDSDLYSSTLFVLTRCHDLLAPGAIIIFDEFSSVLNEFAALRDYCAAYRRDYQVVAITSSYLAQVAIQIK